MSSYLPFASTSSAVSAVRCFVTPVRYTWSKIGMLTDIQINLDNKLSGYIRIINYPFNYPSAWRLIIFMYFLCSFSKFLHYFTKNFVH